MRPPGSGSSSTRSTPMSAAACCARSRCRQPRTPLRREDIETFLAARGSGRAPRSWIGEPAMPTIESAISLIEGGRLYYRGQDAVRLSDNATLEEIAALLWGAELEPAADRSGDADAGAGTPPASGDLIARCQIRLATMAADSRRRRHRPPGPGRRRATHIARNRRLLDRGAAGSPAGPPPARELIGDSATPAPTSCAAAWC